MIYITFLHAGLYTLGLYPEELGPEKYYFQWPVRTKIQCMYQKFLKEGNGDNSFYCVQIFDTTTFRFCVQKCHWIKPTLNVHKMLKLNLRYMIQVFVTYSNTINFASTFLDNSGYLITQCKFFLSKRLSNGSNTGKKQKSDQGWENQWKI